MCRQQLNSESREPSPGTEVLMLVELVTVVTADGIDLDGAMYPSAVTANPSGSEILVLHGLDWNFYRGYSRWLPPLLAEGGYPCLSLNMRDHDLREPKDFELAHHDIKAGIDYLFDRGAREVIVKGHGFSCNKVVCYQALSDDRRVRRWILTTFGAVKSYRPDIWEQVLRRAPQMQRDVYLVQGTADPEIEEVRQRAEDLLAVASSARIEIEYMDANHHFDNRHEELANGILRWLARPPQREAVERR
jgi:hypothetical protein